MNKSTRIPMKIKVLLFLPLVSVFSHAQEIAFDSECRVQAKEAALNTYQSCVKEARTNKIDEIRKEYQEKLTELKGHYDSELKKLSLSNKSSDSNKASDSLSISDDNTPVQPVIQLKKKNKKLSKKGLTSAVSQLPQKKSTSQSIPVQNISNTELSHTNGTDAEAESNSTGVKSKSLNLSAPSEQGEGDSDSAL